MKSETIEQITENASDNFSSQFEVVTISEVKKALAEDYGLRYTEV